MQDKFKLVNHRYKTLPHKILPSCCGKVGTAGLPVEDADRRDEI